MIYAGDMNPKAETYRYYDLASDGFFFKVYLGKNCISREHAQQVQGFSSRKGVSNGSISTFRTGESVNVYVCMGLHSDLYDSYESSPEQYREQESPYQVPTNHQSFIFPAATVSSSSLPSEIHSMKRVAHSRIRETTAVRSVGMIMFESFYLVESTTLL